MKNKRIIIWALLSAVSIIGLGIFVFWWYHSKVPIPFSASERGMFEWREATIQNPKSVQPLIHDLKITKWYQEFPEGWNGASVSEFVSFMHAQGVAVYGLFGAVEWGFERDGATLISHLSQVTDYNKTANQNARIDGVMIDVEPYISSKWKRHREENMKVYVDGMLKAYQSVAEQGLQFAVCIPRYYDDQGLQEDLERLIAQGCDEIAVMNYECGHEAQKIETEARLAQKYGKELHCILEFQEVGKHGLVEDKTYHNKGLTAAWDAWEAVELAYPELTITWDYHYAKPLLEMMGSESS